VACASAISALDLGVPLLVGHLDPRQLHAWRDQHQVTYPLGIPGRVQQRQPSIRRMPE
jgi:hypothetical protein